MKSQRKSRSFTPAPVDSLEDRVVQSGFKFPVMLGPVQTLGYRGNFVLTSRTYEQVQREVDRAIKAFANQFGRAYVANGGVLDANTDRVLGNATSGLLGQVDRIMARVEARLPFGRGYAGNTGGVGLSTYTSATSLSNPSGFSVAEMLDQGLNSGSSTATSLADVRNTIEWVRQETLNIAGRGTMGGVATPGILPAYVTSYGPGGAGYFGLRNT